MSARVLKLKNLARAARANGGAEFFEFVDTLTEERETCLQAMYRGQIPGTRSYLRNPRFRKPADSGEDGS